MAYVVCGIYAFSAISKLIYWQSTIDTMTKILNSSTLGLLGAVAIISIELLLAGSLFLPTLWRFTSSASIVLLILFTLITYAAKLTGKISSCHCFGNFFNGEIDYLFLARNIIFIGLSYSWFTCTNENGELVNGAKHL